MFSDGGQADRREALCSADRAGSKLIPANSRVILLPDGSLYGLNFETLIAPEPKPHCWIEDATLSTATRSRFSHLPPTGQRQREESVAR